MPLAGEETAPVADVVRAALLPAEAVAAARLRIVLALERQHEELVAAAALLERSLDLVVERRRVDRILHAAVLLLEAADRARHRREHEARLVLLRGREREHLPVVLPDDI